MLGVSCSSLLNVFSKFNISNSLSPDPLATAIKLGSTGLMANAFMTVLSLKTTIGALKKMRS